MTKDEAKKLIGLIDFFNKPSSQFWLNGLRKEFPEIGWVLKGGLIQIVETFKAPANEPMKNLEDKTIHDGEIVTVSAVHAVDFSQEESFYQTACQLIAEGDSKRPDSLAAALRETYVLGRWECAEPRKYLRDKTES